MRLASMVFLFAILLFRIAMATARLDPTST